MTMDEFVNSLTLEQKKFLAEWLKKQGDILKGVAEFLPETPAELENERFADNL